MNSDSPSLEQRRDGPVYRRSRKWWVEAALVLSVIINILQVFEIRSFQEPLRRCRSLAASGTAGLDVGQSAPSLKVHDLLGRPITVPVTRPGKMTVVYIFSPSCGWCTRNSRNMNALIRAAGRTYDFVPISLTEAGTQQFLSKADASGVVYVAPSPETRDVFGLGATPQTIVIASNGVILKNWRGAYTGQLLRDVSNVLSVSLPGLADGG